MPLALRQRRASAAADAIAADFRFDISPLRQLRASLRWRHYCRHYFRYDAAYALRHADMMLHCCQR
jgi:hypothetical protein